MGGPMKKLSGIHTFFLPFPLYSSGTKDRLTQVKLQNVGVEIQTHMFIYPSIPLYTQ